MKASYHSKGFLLNSNSVLLIISLFISGLIGWLIYKNSIDTHLDQVLSEQQKRINQAQVLFIREIGDMKRTIRLLHDDPSLSRSIDKNTPINPELAEELFVSFAHSINSLMQVRWIDIQGQEQVRVNAQEGDVYIVPHEQLQNKINRYYVRRGYQTPEGSVYLSSLDLNIEHGKIEIPYQPTIRITLRTGATEPQRDGLLVLNYNIGYLLRAIRTLNTDEVKLQIIDQDGFWIMHPDDRLEWGSDLNKPQNNVKNISPALWKALQKNKEKRELDLNQGMVSYKCSDLTKDFAQTEFNHGSILCFNAVTPKKFVTGLKVKAAIPAILVAIIIFLSGAWVLLRERKASQALINMNQKLETDKQLLKESADYTKNLLEQQHILQNDLVESRKLSALGMMVAGVAHELNTPLGTAIMSSSKLHSEYNKLKASFAEGLTKSALQEYLDSAGHGLDLIEESQRRAAELVRSFKRLAIDRAREESVSFNLNQVIEDLLKTLHHRLKQAQVETRLEVEDIEMSGMPGIISQVIQNLVINTLHHAFTPEMGGVLTVCATLNKEEKQVEIRISDNGKGIDPDVLPNLFDPFVTSKRSQGNTGLGMHFVHQWVTNSLQGTISVETVPDSGTTFIIEIPQKIEMNLPED
ncbi:sensor histidine kinase [Vibrio salinus]|uniref:sensor histidine kinase n=1 Tax=Vibrio salinus TaxID=2899784 RepID=UPI001E3685F4|nr:HAMP domain-containing sensor histidine kinase [Vibrio salinus]MCE0495076.1 HAMP domain-containing histidine kinase [Vibrio salinus]